MASINEQIAALKARFEELQTALGEQAKLREELRIKLAKLNESINCLWSPKNEQSPWRIHMKK